MTKQCSGEKGSEAVDASVAAFLPKDATAEFLDIFNRLKQATASSTDTDLANSLGIKQGSISVAKKRLQVPPSWITKISKSKGVSSDWILYGTGCMRRGEATVAPAEVQMEPARAGVMRAGDRLTTPVAQPEAYANVLSAQADEIAVLRQENRELRLENRELLKENADLRVTVAKLEARAAPERDASKEMPEEEARKSA